jgi:hypothetical protein
MTKILRYKCDRCNAMSENEDCTWLRIEVHRSELDLFRPHDNQAEYCSACERSLLAWQAQGLLDKSIGVK